SSSNGISGWIDIDGAESQSFTTSQTATTYYRAKVTCSGQTATSSAVLVTNPAPFNGPIFVDKTGNTPGAYTSIQAAINSFSCAGINGNVTVNVVAGTGPYAEQVVIPEIGGAASN